MQVVHVTCGTHLPYACLTMSLHSFSHTAASLTTPLKIRYVSLQAELKSVMHSDGTLIIFEGR